MGIDGNGVGELSACAYVFRQRDGGWRSLARRFDHEGGGFGESGVILMLQNYQAHFFKIISM